MVLTRFKLYKIVHHSKCVDKFKRDYIIFSPLETININHRHNHIKCLILINLNGELKTHAFTGFDQDFCYVKELSIGDYIELIYCLKDSFYVYDMRKKKIRFKDGFGER
jgi:hypothetical protein